MCRNQYFKLFRLNIIGFLMIVHTSNAQGTEGNTVGLMLNEELVYEGYTLYTPISQKLTFLINNDGKLLHSWESVSLPGHTIYLHEDGTLYKAGQVEDDPVKTHIIAGGAGGKIERYDWDSDLLWEYEYADATKRHHHDFQVLPNGNVLIIAWEVISKDEAIQAGRDLSTLSTEELWPDHIVEVKPQGATGGEIVWEWHAWDHMIQDFDASKDNYGTVGEHSELIDLNYTKSANPDWHHMNSINYNADLDQILVSVWAFDEIWIIDHSTTTEEAKSHTGGDYGMGGDLLFRWGNPMAYRNGELTDKKLFQQHNAHWIPPGLPNAGKIMIFNNGTNRGDEKYSSIVILKPARGADGKYIKDAEGVFEPKAVDFIYTAPTKGDFFSGRFSSAQQLPNGNILICKGPQGEFLEIDPNNELVWNYINPVTPNGPLYQGESPLGVNSVFRVLKYNIDYPAFAGKTLTAKGNLELNDIVSAINGESGNQKFRIYPNPVNHRLQISGLKNKINEIIIYNLHGKRLKSLTISNNQEINVADLPNGVYLISLDNGEPKKFIIAR